MTQFIVRYRRVWFGLVALMLLLSFNGQWLIGSDSAAYRQLGHQLAKDGRYRFRDPVPGVPAYNDEQTSRYPGLPILLAGVEKLCGRRDALPLDLPPLLVMQAIAILTLVLTYRLMLYRVEPWLAVCVVVGMGTNEGFLQSANELLTDMPFLLGLIMLLLGYEHLVRARRGWPVARALILAFSGFLLAALMRPTFWIVAAALLITCLWGLFYGRAGMVGEARLAQAPDLRPRVDERKVRWRFALLLTVMAVAGAIFLLALDLRTKQSVLGGGYEQRLWSKVQQLVPALAPAEIDNGATRHITHVGQILADQFRDMLQTALPIAFFGTRLGPTILHHWVGFGPLFSLLVLGAGVGLARRNVLWGLLVLFTVGGLTLLWGMIPRYFVMLLPLLLAGWGLMVYRVALGARRARTQNLILCLGLALVFSSNLAVCLEFIFIQRGWTLPMNHKGQWQGFHSIGFLAAFHDGQWVGIHDLAKMVDRTVDPDEKMIGPEATVLTYFSGRQVYPAQAGVPYENQPVLIHLGFFPVPGAQTRFPEYDTELAPLVAQGHLIQGQTLAGPTGGYVIAKMDVKGWPVRLDYIARERIERHRSHKDRRLEREEAEPVTADQNTTEPATEPAP